MRDSSSSFNAGRGRKTRILAATLASAAVAVIALVVVFSAHVATDLPRSGTSDGGDSGGGDSGGGSIDAQTAQESIRIDAIYYKQNKTAVIAYVDNTGVNVTVTVEVLGMADTYRREFTGPQFSTSVHFPTVPKYGWAVHPVVSEVRHPVFGDVQIKTEIREEGQPAPRTIYADLR
ncbi:MAG: hypothetical protein J4F28_05695 [Nitrosopumilaceae archaeon]|nr:hypothetical protein [Nitrosopumilaceae archaeon]